MVDESPAAWVGERLAAHERLTGALGMALLLPNCLWILAEVFGYVEPGKLTQELHTALRLLLVYTLVVGMGVSTFQRWARWAALPILLAALIVPPLGLAGLWILFSRRGAVVFSPPYRALVEG